MSSGTIYSQAEYAKVDVGLQMRSGHPYIAEGDDLIVNLCRQHASRSPRPLRILEVGSGSGYLLERLHQAIPDASLVANEMEPALVELARDRFRHTPVTVFADPFEHWSEPVDILISWGAYHHMMSSTAHLPHAASLLGSSGTFIFGDEFCPDYLDGDDRVRLAAADVVYLADGYVLFRREEVAAFEEYGTVPAWSVAMERRRRQALWTWYKFVIDVAMDRGDDVVVDAELRIAGDDMSTGFAHEHKLAVPIVLRDLALHGFVERSRTSLESDPSRASFFVLELGCGGEEQQPRAPG